MNRIVKWDGQQWHALANGITAAPSFGVNAIASFDDGSGDALYVAGAFTAVDGKPMSRIAKWDGSEWSDVGGGTNGTVHELQVFDDGSGAKLYVAGAFTEVGAGPSTVLASRLAAWNDGKWEDVGGDISGFVGSVTKDLTGQGLYLGGNFTGVGGPDWQTSNYISRWVGCAEPGSGKSADLNGDGIVSTADLLILLTAWGTCHDCDDCLADIDGNCEVNTYDLLELLENWDS